MNKFLRPCKIQGCPELTRELYCEKHRHYLTALKTQYDKKRKPAHLRGYTARWHKEAKRFLRNYPLCKPCYSKNIRTPAEQVDHIIPHRGNMKLFWDRKNWQPICRICHDIKTKKGN